MSTRSPSFNNISHIYLSLLLLHKAIPYLLDLKEHLVAKNCNCTILFLFLQWLNIVSVEFFVMSQEEMLQQTRRKIFDELTKIVDPEIGVSIMELELVDKVDIDSGKVKVDLHLTSPFCPAIFGFKIAQDVRDNIYKLSGVDSVNVNVSNHFMAEAINKQVNESKYPPKPGA